MSAACEAPMEVTFSESSSLRSSSSPIVIIFIIVIIVMTEVSETLVVAFLGAIIVLSWFLVLLLLIFTVKEARRQKAKLQKRAEIANREGGVAELLASELHKSLYMTEKMLKCHREFKSLYDRMPVDYPDAFTINMAKVLQEGR